MAVADIYELKLVGHDVDGNQWNNVLHYDCSDAAIVGTTEFEEAGDVINAWQTNNQPNFLRVLPNDTTFQYITCRRVIPTGGATSIALLNVMGTATTAEDTIGIGAVLRFIVDIAGRGHQGRMFIPGMPIGGHIKNFLAVGYTGDLVVLNTSLASALIGPVYAGVYVQTILNRKLGTFRDVVDWGISIGVHCFRKRLLPRF